MISKRKPLLIDALAVMILAVLVLHIPMIDYRALREIRKSVRRRKTSFDKPRDAISYYKSDVQRFLRGSLTWWIFLVIAIMIPFRTRIKKRILKKIEEMEAMHAVVA